MKDNKGKSTVNPILTLKGKTREKVLEIVSLKQNGIAKSDPHLLGRRITLRSLNRKITVSADMYVEDDETFGSNETVRRQQTNSAILSSEGVAQTVMDFEVRMGGEIRVEFMLTASLIDSNGNVVINGDVKLFEGASESTGDLDGERQFQLYCPKNGTLNYFVRVNNDDEGGDYTTIQMNITNTNV